MTNTYTPVVDVEAMVEHGMSEGRTKPLRLGLYVREHLRLKGSDFQYSIWKCYMQACEEKGYKGCKYQSFRTYFHSLKTLKL